MTISAFHPQQKSEWLPPHVAERLHSGDGEAARNDRHGRRADLNGTDLLRRPSTLHGHSLAIRRAPEVDPLLTFIRS